MILFYVSQCTLSLDHFIYFSVQHLLNHLSVCSQWTKNYKRKVHVLDDMVDVEDNIIKVKP